MRTIGHMCRSVHFEQSAGSALNFIFVLLLLPSRCSILKQHWSLSVLPPTAKKTRHIYEEEVSIVETK